MERFPARRSTFVALAGVFLAAALAGVSPAEEVRLRQGQNQVHITRGAVSLVFDAAGRGFVTSAKRGDREVCAASASSGLFCSLIVPDGRAGPLEPIRGRQVAGVVTVKSVTGRKAAGKGEVALTGTVSLGRFGEAPFTVRVAIPQSGPAMSVWAELTPPKEARKCFLASFGLAVPLNLTFHPTSKGKPPLDRKTAAAAILPRAGTGVPEVRWMVARQDDTSVWGQMLWTLAGVRQAAPASFEVWEAWGRANPPFVLQHHNVHPGWMAVADGGVAVAAGMVGIAEVAPKEIYADSQAKVLRICFQSPYCRPLDLSSAPATLSAGPAYVFLEAAEANTRKADDYRDARKRPALAAIGEHLAKLPATKCNFSAMKLVQPAPRRDPPLVPADPQFASHEPGKPDEIALWVDEPNGADLAAWPITRGVPLKRGVLKDAKKAALFDAAGKPVPCVARAVAFWPDKSVKWLLLDFQTRLQAGTGAKLKLIVGDRAKPAPIPRPLEVIEAADSIAVDTGKLNLALANRAGKLAMTVGLDLNGNGKVAADETIIKPGGTILGCLFTHIRDAERYRSRVWLDPGEADPGTVEIKELRIEERSGLRAVVLVRADLKHKLLASTIPQKHRPPVGTPVTLRFHLYAGSSLVRVQHTFMFAGDVKLDFLRQLGVHLPLPAQAGQKVRTSLDGVALELPRQGEGGLLQEAPDSALAWQAEGGRAKILARGRVADGWLDVSGKDWGVTVGLRHMREMFPQEIHVAPEGIWTHFYSPRVVPMDVRRYAFKYGDGESTSTGWGTAFGALRTHEAYWFFHPGGEQSAKGSVHVKAMLDPPLARVRPRHVADTLAVGHVAEHGAAASDKHFDAVLYHMPRMHQHNRGFWRWHGFWDHGDEIQVYTAARHRWAKDDGRHGWYNNEPLRDYNYHLAYLMTGSRRIWQQAEAMSYHVFEVDLRHASPQPFMSASPSFAKQVYSHSTTAGIDFCGRRHNAQHWSDGYWGRRVGSPPGFRLCYYQSGDPVMREYLQRILAAALTTRRSQYMHADSDEAVLWAMLMGYEMTLARKYLDRIKSYTDLQVEFARKHNGIPAGQANWDWATNAPGAPPQSPRDDLWMWSFGGHVAFIEVADVFGDPAVDRFLREWLLALEGFGPDKRRREKWSNNIGACCLLAYYYRRTGDKRALAWFQQRDKRFHSNIPQAAPRRDLPTRVMQTTLPAYTPNDGYGWVFCTSSFWYIGIPAWQGALRARAAK